MAINILGIETSCDDTSAAVLSDGFILSNITNTQIIHTNYGGVVPEIASRAHQQNIVLVVEEALKKANMLTTDISAIAFTTSPGLLGSLLVGSSFAKGLSLALNIPIIGINHLQGHIYAAFLNDKPDDYNTQIECSKPSFPFLCLLVSGGHTQIIQVDDYFHFNILGNTLDDAAGEAFDKCAKIMGLPYPGGPIIDKYAQKGDKNKFEFNKPIIKDLNYSFSGLKTSFLYFIKEQIKTNENFIQDNIYDLCASLQSEIVKVLMNKFTKAIKQTKINEIVISGGVSANSELRQAVTELASKYNLNLHLPKIKYTTDNAAMIAQVGYFAFLNKKFDSLDLVPKAKLE